MQQNSQTISEFIRRTDVLSERLSLNLSEIPDVLGISKAMLYAYRQGKNRITNKVWLKLERAEKEESSANLKDSGIGESALSMREESPPYGAGMTEMRLREVSERDAEIMLAFRKIREGLDLLEEMMKKGHR